MRYLLILLSLLLLTGVTCSRRTDKSASKEATPSVNTTVEPSVPDLQVAEDVERGVICYRFSAREGIFCMKKSELLQTPADLKDRF
jgi:hypothetical protein